MWKSLKDSRESERTLEMSGLQGQGKGPGHGARGRKRRPGDGSKGGETADPETKREGRFESV